jgi:hypothetical protein
VWREWKETHPEQFADSAVSSDRGFSVDVLVVAEAHAEGRASGLGAGEDAGATRAIAQP